MNLNWLRGTTRPAAHHLPPTSHVLAVVLVACAASNAPAEPRPAWPPWPEPALALYRFDDLQWQAWQRPPALGFDSAQVMESWSEFSLVRDALSVSPVAIPTVDASGKPGFAPATGAVRFWFCPHWSSMDNGGLGPGSYARLLELVSLDANNLQTRWSLYLGEAGDAIYFSGINSAGQPTDYLAVKADFVQGEWQMVTLCYSEKESQLWLNGQLVTEGEGVPAPSSWQVPSLGLLIGSDLAAGNTANGQFDEVATFDHWPEEEALYFSGVSRQVFLGTVDSPVEEALKAELQAELFPQMSLFEEEGGGGMQMAYSYSAGELWLEITGASNQTAYLTLHGTEPFVAYEIQSTEDLTSAWAYETTILGADASDQTPFQVSMGARTNALFFRALSYVDDDGDGLPDWWELEHGLDPGNPDTGGTGVSDGYKDADGDGWTNLAEYENGTNPNGFNTPAAPQGFRVRLGAGGVDAVLTWQPANGPVIEYVVEKGFGIFFTNAPASFVDAGVTLPTDFYWWDSIEAYRVKARYPGGDSAWTPDRDIEEAINPATVSVVGDIEGVRSILALNLPTGTIGVWLEGFTVNPIGTEAFVTNVFVPVSQNPVAAEPLPAWAQGAQFDWAWTQQVVRSNGVRTVVEWVQAVEPWGLFADGREHMRQNLIFQLRSANPTEPLDLVVEGGWRYRSFDDYAHASYFDPLNSIPSDWLRAWFPFEMNCDLRNAAYDPVWLNGSDGWLDTGLSHDEDELQFTLSGLIAHEFTDYGNYGAITSLLSAAETEWLQPDDRENEYGMNWVSGTNGSFLVMTQGMRSLYGLPYESARAVWAGGMNGLRHGSVHAGGSLTNLDATALYFWVYPATAQPILTNAGYYFATWANLLPGDSGFQNNSESPLLITSVGDPYFNVVGYAKLAILNGYSNVFGYLGQYFDRAYRANPDGTRSTNETGFLSPYGYYFPTEAGRTILTTMPDGVSTNVGECTVHVIGLNVDANHDGVMDLSITGPDQTSLGRPYRFWINDDKDHGETGGNDLPLGAAAGANGANGQDNLVNGVRDLVDFFPVSLNLQSLLQSLTTNEIQASWQVRLRHDESALKFAYAGIHSTNCQAYLTDTTVAGSLSNAFSHTITDTGTTLFNSFLYQIRATGEGVILVEAQQATTAPLILEVRQNGQVVAQSEVHLSISGVEDMFRHKNLIWELEECAEGPPDRLTDGSVPNEPPTNDRNFIFVHGYNVNPTSARATFSETFKRMYWAGSQARFYGVSWYGYETQDIAGGKFTPNYHINVDNAFESAPLLRNFADSLTNGPVVLTAHSLGNMMALSAINDHAAPIERYFMLNAAVAVEAVDGGAPPVFHMTHGEWVDPENYATRLYASYWWALFGTNDHRNRLTWSNRLGNFQATEVYNFYSNGEEVLRAYNDDPPLDVLGTLETLANYRENQFPMGSFAWVWQEKGKGRSFSDTVLGSTHGGWKFNSGYDTNGAHLPAVVADVLPGAQLQTNAFFDMSYDPVLFGPAGSAYAQLNRNRILSDAIPAMSWAVGANLVQSLEPEGRNFNMHSTQFQNGWPPVRLQDVQEFDKWWHSDFKDVAYTYTYKLFEQFVEMGALE